MPELPDLTDPRYLDEVGWFIYHEKYRCDQFGGSYDAERLAYSRLLLDEVITYLGGEATWIEGKAIVSLGCGCTGDLAAFPGGQNRPSIPSLRIPDVYQRLGMLVGDEAGSRTAYLPIGATNLPLLDDCADLVICRNAVDHMADPEATEEIARIVNADGPYSSAWISEESLLRTSQQSSPWQASATCSRNTLRWPLLRTTILPIAEGDSAAFAWWRDGNLESLRSSTKSRSSKPTRLVCLVVESDRGAERA